MGFRGLCGGDDGGRAGLGRSKSLEEGKEARTGGAQAGGSVPYAS